MATKPIHDDVVAQAKSDGERTKKLTSPKMIIQIVIVTSPLIPSERA